MLFNSLHFAIFFPVVVAVYFALPHRFRWVFLLLASYYFYMAFIPVYVLLLLTSTLVDYTGARLMDRAQSPRGRCLFLYLSLATNLGLLFTFKYFNFFADTVQAAFTYFSLPYHAPMSRLLLPVGISFYTFQELGYVIDVYRRKIPAERHLGIFALFVTFFPQLLAGPIERAGHMLPQFRLKHDFDYRRVTDGIKLMTWGLFKKVVIADRVAVMVDYVYSNPQSHTGPGLALASVMFAFQLYCDFSGYSDMAIGAAQVLGFQLVTNFDRPYFSRSLPEVWRRWHISLMSWFRDYIFIPLGGSRGSRARTCLNIMIVFSICGLWHGASWNFVTWGMFEGLILIISLLTYNLREQVAAKIGFNRFPRLRHVWQIGVTFVLFCIPAPLFRGQSMLDAYYGFTGYLTGWSDPFRGLSFDDFIISLGMRRVEDFHVAIVAIAILVIAQFMQRKGPIRPRLALQPVWVRWPLYYAGVLVILIYGTFTSSPFIYFQF